MKISNLLEKDFKIVEKKKIWFIIPACIVAVAIAVMVIFGVTTGEPLNLGMDFTGGYTINVSLSTKLTDSTYQTYTEQVTDIIEELKDENGNSYGLKVANIQRQGSGDTAALYVKYKAAPDADDARMNDEINPAIEEALGEVFKIIPAVTSEGDNHTVTYSDFRLVDDTFKQKSESIKAAVSGASGFALSDDRKSITFTASGVSES